MQVNRLTGTFGAQVSDIDLSELKDHDFIHLADTLWEHQVLVFKNQNLDVSDHIRLGNLFGELHTHPSALGLPDHPEVLVIANEGKEKNITEVWHSDVCCEQRPPSISILQAIKTPDHGGDTMWANQYEALNRLSPAMRAMLEPLRATHKGFEMEATHPVIRTHPETGRQALYVNHGFTSHFDGMTKEESLPLLNYLIDIAASPDLTMRHSWSEGDIVIWDNRCVMHYAIHDYADASRRMHRVTVIGEIPQ